MIRGNTDIDIGRMMVRIQAENIEKRMMEEDTDEKIANDVLSNTEMKTRT